MKRNLGVLLVVALALLALAIPAVIAQDVAPTVVPLNPTLAPVNPTVITPIEPLQVQPIDPQVTVLPQALERLSWGAVLAGAVIAFIIQIALNLLAIGIGMNKINPEYGKDSADAKTLGVGAIASIYISAIISLVIGGFLAARFAGIPDEVDGLLHGVMVWGIVTLVTVFLLTTTLGKLISGVSSILGEGLRLAGVATGAVASGAANVVQGVASTAASAAQSAGATVADKAQDALNEGGGGNGYYGQNGQSSPDIVQRIKDEAMQLMRQAGVAPEMVSEQVQGARGELTDAAKQAAKNPSDAAQIVGDAINRVFQRGQQVTSQADRQSLVQVLMERGNMNEQQANETLARWEQQAEQARTQAEQTAQQTKQRAQEMAREVQVKAEQAKRDAERTAREAAQKTTDALAKLALAGFFAILLGAVAGGLGGLIGAPEVLPTAQVEASAQVVEQVR